MFVNQKAQEICLAILRVASYVRRQAFKYQLEKLSLQLLESVHFKQFEEASDNVVGLQSMVALAKSLYEIDPANAAILSSELAGLDSAIRKFSGFDKSLEIQSIFSKNLDINGSSGFVNAVSKSSYESIDNKEPNGNGNGGNGNGINAVVRQSAIIDKIRQSGKSSLKDMLAEFPEFSERTIRYDLQKLSNQGVIERIGNGGPATYYILKNPAVADSFSSENGNH